MTIIEANQLVSILKEENKTNTPEEREFNNNWIRLIYKAFENALSKRDIKP
jgi:4-alpha-glucanotransferase